MLNRHRLELLACVWTMASLLVACNAQRPRDGQLAPTTTTPATASPTAAPTLENDPCARMRGDSFVRGGGGPRHISFEPAEVRTGDSLTVRANGFPPGTAVQVHFAQPGDVTPPASATAVADASGDVEVHLSVPYMPELVQRARAGQLPFPCVAVSVRSAAGNTSDLLAYVP